MYPMPQGPTQPREPTQREVAAANEAQQQLEERAEESLERGDHDFRAWLIEEVEADVLAAFMSLALDFARCSLPRPGREGAYCELAEQAARWRDDYREYFVALHDDDLADLTHECMYDDDAPDRSAA